MTRGAPTAFFSYSREDSDFVLRLAEDLKAAGANVWLDQLDITPGDRWDRAVEDALVNCSRMLVILSPAAVNSTNVMDEVSFALEEEKTVIPVIHKDCTTPFRLRRVQHVDFRRDYARGLKELLKTLAPEQQSAQMTPVIPEVQSRKTDVTDTGERERAAEEQRKTTEAHRQAAEQAPLGEELRWAAEQTRLEEERRRAAEQVQLELERQQAAERSQVEEQARREQGNRQKEEVSLPAELERRRVAAENEGQREKEENNKAVSPGLSMFSQLPIWARIVIVSFGILAVALVLFRAVYSHTPQLQETSVPVQPLTQQPIGAAQPLVKAETPRFGWAGGEEGIILHTEDGGQSWRKEDSGTSEWINSFSFATPHSGWAVGHLGAILHTEDGGRTWQEQYKAREILQFVTFQTPLAGWAAGLNGIVLHTEDGGRSWERRNIGTTNSLNSIVFVTPQIGWAVGDFASTYEGTILHTEDGGRSWQTQNAHTRGIHLNAIAFVTPQSGWAVGGNDAQNEGTILHTEDAGQSWKRQYYAGTRGIFEAVAFVTPQSGWAAGRGGILHTEDGGRTWQEQYKETVSSVVFVTPQSGWAVGKGVLHTEDGGRSWEKQDSWKDLDLRCLTFISQ